MHHTAAARGSPKSEGWQRLVFSFTVHASMRMGLRLVVERDDYQDDRTLTLSVQVSQYRSLTPPKGIGIAGQPQPRASLLPPPHTRCWR
jgi:hypothetical protein